MNRSPLNLRLYNIRNRTAIDTDTWLNTQSNANRVPGLLQRVESLSGDIAQQRTSLEKIEQDYRAETQKNAQLWDKNAQLTEHTRQYELLNGLFGSLNLDVPIVGQPNRQIVQLEQMLAPALPNLKAILTNLNYAAAAADLGVQRTKHPRYSNFRGDDKGYIQTLITNTTFSNPSSVALAGQQMTDDLKSAFANTSANWELLSTLATNKSTAILLNEAGSDAVRTIVEQGIRYAGNASQMAQLYDTLLKGPLAQYTSDTLKSRIAQAKISQLTETEYGQIPMIVAEMKEVIQPGILGEAVKDIIIKNLYAAKPEIVRSLSQHSGLEDVLQDYTAEKIFDDAVGRLAINVTRPQEVVAASENLYAAARALEVHLPEQTGKILATNYVVAILSVNDTRRLEDAISNPAVMSIGDEGLLNAISLYVRDTFVPRSSSEAGFSTGLLMRYQEGLKRDLGNHAYYLILTRSAGKNDLGQLAGFRKHELYAKDPAVGRILDERADTLAAGLFTQKYGEQMQNADIEGIVNVSADLPGSSNTILLGGVLDFIRDRESRVRSAGKISQNLSPEDAQRTYDASIARSFEWNVSGDGRYYITNDPSRFAHTLNLMGERLFNFGNGGMDVMLEGLFTTRYAMQAPKITLVALNRVADSRDLRDYLTQNAKNQVFISYINDCIAERQRTRDQQDRRQQQDPLEALITSNAYRFPMATVQRLVSHYLESARAGGYTNSIQTNLQNLLDNVKILNSERGAAVSNAVSALVYDSDRDRIIPYDMESNAHIDLIIRYREGITIEALAQVTNNSLRSLTASNSNSARHQDYIALKKFDRSAIGADVEPSVRSNVYDKEILAQADWIDNMRRQVEQERAVRSGSGSNTGRFYTQSLESLDHFVDDERQYLLTPHLSSVIDIYLINGQLARAKNLFERSPTVREMLTGTIVQRAEASKQAWGRNLEHFLGEYITAFDGLVAPDVISSWQSQLTK